MSKLQFTITSEVWKWPGFAGWHFITLPKKVSAEIKKLGVSYGAGFVKVEVTLKHSTWTTALFPHKDSEGYLLSIKKKVREKENIWEGDRVSVKINVCSNG